jgi:hypothetical protein
MTMESFFPEHDPEDDAIDWSVFNVYESLQKPGSTDIR